MKVLAGLLAGAALIAGAATCRADEITAKKMAPIHPNLPAPAGCGAHDDRGCCAKLCAYFSYCTQPLFGYHKCCHSHRPVPCCYPPLYTFFLCDDYAGCRHGACGAGACGKGGSCATCPKAGCATCPK